MGTISMGGSISTLYIDETITETLAIRLPSRSPNHLCPYYFVAMSVHLLPEPNPAPMQWFRRLLLSASPLGVREELASPLLHVAVQGAAAVAREVRSLSEIRKYPTAVSNSY